MSEDKTGGPPPGGEELPGHKPEQATPPLEKTASESQPADAGAGAIDSPYVEDPYADDPYGGAGASGSPETTTAAPSAVEGANTGPEISATPEPPSVSTPSTAIVASPSGGQTPPRKPPPPPPPADEEEGMLRMSFMDHLSELRKRIIKSLWGFGVAFLASLVFANELWKIISDPATEALKFLKVVPPRLAMTQPMEGFSIIWVKLPILCAIFLTSPWVVYQIWKFISPGLYKREKRLAVPFILSTAGLFIGGGLFAYFLAFRYGLTFLLSIGMSNNVQPVVTITEYFDLFVNVTLGVGLVFELPVIIFMLTLLRLASPRFLLKHSRYAVLIIVIVAAVVTPTPDVVNLMIFAVPMCALYFVGVFLGYLIVLKREGKKFPWRRVFLILGLVIVVLLIMAVVAIAHYHYHGWHFTSHWPFITQGK
jgi:sec-independent protein translocase protein TatC